MGLERVIFKWFRKRAVKHETLSLARMSPLVSDIGGVGAGERHCQALRQLAFHHPMLDF
jgi:hypothetical protein